MLNETDPGSASGSKTAAAVGAIQLFCQLIGVAADAEVTPTV